MFVEQFRFGPDNLGYFVYSKSEGVAIDAGAVDAILGFADQKNIRIKVVANTHQHYDHIPGNKRILKETGAEFIDSNEIKSDRTLLLEGETLEIWPAPGHSEDSVIFKTDDFLITGDTLFNGTIGNCFTGDLRAFFLSLKRLITLEGDTKIYAGHDYVMEAMEMARVIEKDNPDVEAYIKKYNPAHIVSTLDDELKVNPFIRFNSKAVKKILKDKNKRRETEFDRFKSIMEIY